MSDQPAQPVPHSSAPDPTGRGAADGFAPQAGASGPQQWEAELRRSGRVVVRAPRTLRTVAIALTAGTIALCFGAAIGLPIAFGPVALLVATGPLVIIAVLAGVFLAMQISYLGRDLVVTACGIQVGRRAPVPWHELAGVSTHRGALRIHVLRSGRPETLQLGDLQAPCEQLVRWLQPKAFPAALP
ncbi:hypothetical protein BCE75_104137 [Isoptericola sp. CG 20/1183]|uniref:PH domain-containing protein n=1 Tax=Isoptericola halotolerans TaxID=300560 RepID=A0ABX5EEW1_9MICO|nr:MULTISPECIES: hypothetical protein [Isoptericola]PRZ07685.1 hypothetical protein BCL65_104128 [Isoptericola halotolerans]PRZ07956.1 hypothetical protein BCE75_104137 [Isoptericola sp. CG 20/1183]